MTDQSSGPQPGVLDGNGQVGLKLEEEKIMMAHERLHIDGKGWTVSEDEPAASRRVGPGLVPALENAIAIVELLNGPAKTSASLAEIRIALDISKSHCHSLLKTLQFFGWLRFDERSATYRLAPGILASASSLLNVPALSIIRREAEALVETAGMPCVMSQPLDDGGFILLERFSHHRMMEVSLPIGYRYPRDAWGQMRALMGWQDTAALNNWLAEWTPHAYTKASPTARDAIAREVANTRKRGYARSAEEFTEGLSAIALPVFDRDGNVSFILNCSAPTAVMQENEAKAVAALQQAVATIHRETLARVPPDFPT